MRKLAVGSGRRKNKNSFPFCYRQNMVSESIQAYGEILDFGSRAHTNPCKPFTLKPNFEEKSSYYFRNGFDELERKEFSSDMSSITFPDLVGNGGKANSVLQESVTKNFQKCCPRIWVFPSPCPPNRDSQILGKHSRETESTDENNLWFPKTLRIDDLSESAKSSIWSALGIKNQKNDIIKGKVVFKSFESNENDEQYVRDNSLVLQANPAALARSLNFRENA